MEDPSAPRMRYKVIGPRKPKRVSKGPWERRIRKGPRKSKESIWAKNAQEGNRTQEPTNNVRKGPMNTLSHWEGNKQQVQRGPTGLSQTTLQQEYKSGMTRNANKATKWIQSRSREGRPMIWQGPTPKKKQVIKNDRSENNPRHKKLKVHDRTYKPISRSRQMHE